jgi:hypothetical protein
VDLTEDFHPVNTDGEPERRLWLFGILTEGSRYFTLYIPSPKSRVRAFMDVEVAVDEIMTRAQATVTSGDRQPAQPVEVAAAAGGAGVS